MLLGDRVKAALSIVGVTQERVKKVVNSLGIEDCGCERRQQVLNELDLWARRVFKKGARGMKGYLERMMGDWSDDET